MSSESVEIVRRAVQTWMSGDVDGAFAFLDDEVEWIEPPEQLDRTVVTGPTAAAASMSNWLTLWSSYRYELTDVIDSGDDVIQAGGQIMDARGAAVSSDLFFVWSFRDGRAIRMQMFFHRGQAFRRPDWHSRRCRGRTLASPNACRDNSSQPVNRHGAVAWGRRGPRLRHPILGPRLIECARAVCDGAAHRTSSERSTHRSLGPR